MTSKIKKLLTFLFFTTLIFLLISNTNLIISSVIKSAEIFFYKVFPSLFPFFILIDFLINYNFQDYLNKIFSKTFLGLFKISPSSSFIIIMSLLSGLPSNAKMVKDLLDENTISTNEATKIMTFTFFPNPMFVIGTVGTIMLKSTTTGIKILLITYLTNFIIGLLIRNKYITKNIQKKYKLKTTKTNFSNVLKSSITKSFEALTIILGSITIFTVLSNLFSLYSPFNENINAIITSIFEMTSGINQISELLINTKTKIMLMSASLSFTGLCIISQAWAVLSNDNLDFTFIIKYRLLSIIINLILTYLLF